MKDYRQIDNLNDLEKEIHFLEHESKIIEEKLTGNFNYLKKNCLSMTLHTIFSKKNTSKEGFWKSFLESAGIKETANKFSENIAAKAGDAFKNIMERFFRHKQN